MSNSRRSTRVVKVDDYTEGGLIDLIGAPSADPPVQFGKTKTRITKLQFGDDKRKVVLKAHRVVLVRAQNNTLFLQTDPDNKLPSVLADIEEAVVGLTCASTAEWFSSKTFDADALAEIFQPSIVFDKKHGKVLRLHMINALGTEDMQVDGEHSLMLVPYCIRFTSSAFQLLWQVQAQLVIDEVPQPIGEDDDNDGSVVPGAAEDIQEAIPHEDLVAMTDTLSGQAKEIMEACNDGVRVLQNRFDIAAGVLKYLESAPTMKTLVQADIKLRELIDSFQT